MGIQIKNIAGRQFDLYVGGDHSKTPPKVAKRIEVLRGQNQVGEANDVPSFTKITAEDKAMLLADPVAAHWFQPEQGALSFVDDAPAKAPAKDDDKK